MTAIINPPKLLAEERFVLHDVSWETYEQLLKNYEDRRFPRLTYDQGALEIFMSPSLPHEQASRILAMLVNIICEERTLDVVDLGSTTHKRPDLLKGFEPDGCFYIQNADVIRGQRKLDLSFLPPADLAIECDVTSPSLPKLPIYAAIGVPEVWVYSDGQVSFFRLESGHYIQSTESGCLPRVLASDIAKFVEESATMKTPQWLRSVRKWIRSLN